MSAQVLLLRGVNVGGRGKLAMAELRALLEDLGAGEARTYIQSGNAVVARAVDPAAVADRIEAEHGFRPGVFALNAEEWRTRIAARPFEADDKALHLFLAREGVADLAPLEALAAVTEQVAVREGAIWLWAPEGIGRSKLAKGMERAAGMELTARNWRSVAAVSALLDEVEAG